MSEYPQRLELEILGIPYLILRCRPPATLQDIAIWIAETYNELMSDPSQPPLDVAPDGPYWMHNDIWYYCFTDQERIPYLVISGCCGSESTAPENTLLQKVKIRPMEDEQADFWPFMERLTQQLPSSFSAYSG